MHKRIVALFIFFLPLLVVAQLGRPKPLVYVFGFYDHRGQPINPRSPDYSVAIFYDNDHTHQRIVSWTYSQQKYKIKTQAGQAIRVVVTGEGHKMTVHSTGGCGADSLVFTPGEYTIDLDWAAIFLVKLYGRAYVNNFSLASLKTGAVTKPPIARFYWQKPRPDANDTNKDCWRYARLIEATHGGNGWAGSPCINPNISGIITNNPAVKKRFDALASTNKLIRRVKIWPLNRRSWLMLEYLGGSLGISPVQTLKISKNNGRSWERLVSVPDDEHMSVVYFADRHQIGLLTHGALLISDYKFRNWKYYNIENPRAVPERGAPAFCFRTDDWNKDLFGNFVFSDEVFDNNKRDINSGLDVVPCNVGDTIRFTTSVREGIRLPTMSCACGNKDFYYRLYREDSGVWQLYRNHTEGPLAHRCECQTQFANIRPGTPYSIAPVTIGGSYYLELPTMNGIQVKSQVFWVKPQSD